MAADARGRLEDYAAPSNDAAAAFTLRIANCLSARGFAPERSIPRDCLARRAGDNSALGSATFVMALPYRRHFRTGDCRQLGSSRHDCGRQRSVTVIDRTAAACECAGDACLGLAEAVANLVRGRRGDQPAA